jgi:hypothetical protein
MHCQSPSLLNFQTNAVGLNQPLKLGLKLVIVANVIIACWLLRHL